MPQWVVFVIVWVQQWPIAKPREDKPGTRKYASPRNGGELRGLILDLCAICCSLSAHQRPTYSKAMQCSNGCTHLSRPWFAMASCHQVVCSCRCKCLHSLVALWGGGTQRFRPCDCTDGSFTAVSLVTSKHKESHGSPSCFVAVFCLGLML